VTFFLYPHLVAPTLIRLAQEMKLFSKKDKKKDE